MSVEKLEQFYVQRIAEMAAGEAKRSAHLILQRDEALETVVELEKQKKLLEDANAELSLRASKAPDSTHTDT